MSDSKELELKERELALKEKELGLKENGSKGTSKWKLILTVLIILLLLSAVGFLGADRLKQLGYLGTGNSKELELKEKELALKEKELGLKQKSSKESDPVKAGNTNKTETVASTKGCQPTNVVNFKGGTSGQTFKCQMSGKNGQVKYTLNANEGQMFYIEFEANGAGSAPHAVYTVADPDGVLRIEDAEGNSQGPLEKTGKYTVTVDLTSSASNPSAEYTITFKIAAPDGS